MKEEWTPPEAFDEYRIVRPLGRGGMGRVYLGHDVLLDRAVAVKFIAEVEPDAIRRERFVVEGRAIARLAHPNVVAVHRVGEVEGRPYLIAEFVRGKSLDKLDKPVPEGALLRIGLGLSRGLAAAHRQGILHRDLKPANAVLADDGEVKLLDFGLAKFVPDDASHDAPTPQPSPEPLAEPTETSVTDLQGLSDGRRPLGTPLYMAPEVLRGEPASRRSDLYSLGALLFELCAGVPPRPRGRWVDPPGARTTPLLELAPKADPRLAQVLDRCLQTDPALRFDSADELLDALTQLLPEARLAAVPKGNPYRGLQPFEAEHRGLFFGRDADIRAVLERLREGPLVLVAGDSGVGKSSLCKAGVLPLLEDGSGEAAGQKLSVTRLVPGRRPLDALATALSSTLETNPEALAAWIRSDPGALARALRQQQLPRPGEARLLFVDQLEELFTLAEPEDARLFAEVLAALPAQVPGVRVLATVRGDFFTRLAALPGLGPEVSRALYLLRPLGQEQIREAITGPARRKGVTFESEEMVDVLVASAVRAAGGLPLLEFALAELWDARDLSKGVIPVAGLERIGGVEGALARHADEVLARLVPEQRAAARRVLLRLVTAEGTRARKTAEELGAGDAASREALEALVQGRLLVARDGNAGTTVEVAHEALLAGWGTLREWLEVDGDRRLVRQRVEEAAREWERFGRKANLLWGRERLDEVTRLGQGELVGGARDFVAASGRLVSRRRFFRRAAILGTPVLLLVAVAARQVERKLEWDALEARATAEIAGPLSAAREQAAAAVATREQAFAEYDSDIGPGAEPSSWDRAELAWKKALTLEEGAERDYVRASQPLDAALLVQAELPKIRASAATVILERLQLALRRGRQEQAGELEARLSGFDTDGSRLRTLHTPAELRFAASPANAVVEISRYVKQGSRLVPSRVALRPVSEAPLLVLQPGAYQLTLRADGYATVRDTINLDAGERLDRRIDLPREAEVPPGFLLIPAGRFLYGSPDPEEVRAALDGAPPLHLVSTGAYLIERTETTFGQWIDYLDDLPAAERKVRLPKSSYAQSSIELVPGPRPAAWTLLFHSTTATVRSGQGALIHYQGRDHHRDQAWLRMPVSGISADDAGQYLAWLARTGRVPGARFCTEHEWERASRGADGRRFVAGDVLEPEDANYDETHGREGGAGPDEVGSHQGDLSPFGLQDAEGNVMELVASVRRREPFVTRGSGWLFNDWLARLMNRTPLSASSRSPILGLRACASWTK